MLRTLWLRPYGADNMAIQFARLEIIHAKSGDAVGFSSYMSRDERRNDLTGERFDFRARGSDLVAHEVILPDGSPEAFRDPAKLWNAAATAEMVRDRKTGELRYSNHGDPRVARNFTLPLPREIGRELYRDMIRDWVEHEGFVTRGAGVEYAIHDEGGGNPHAHILVTDREITTTGFGKHLRDDAGRFRRAGKGRGFLADRIDQGKKWADFQKSWAASRGIDLEIDGTAAVPGTHVGNARMAESEKVAAAEKARALTRAIWGDPQKTLEHLTAKKSIFTQRDVEAGLRKAGFNETEVRVRTAKILRQAVRIQDARGRHFWTSPAVQTQEREMRLNALALRKERAGIAVDAKSREKVLAARPLGGEQRAAFAYAISADRIGVIQGRAGTGKSFTIGAIRDAYESAGARVIGLAPTNAVASDLRKNGFSEGRTVASELKRQENLTLPWDKNTVVVVDEAGMLSTNNISQILSHTKETGAKLLLVGDDRQLASIERGGMFRHVAKAAQAVELAEVRRQKDEWMRDASIAASRGDLKSAVAAYGSNDRIMIGETQDNAIEQLTQDWRQEAVWQKSEPFVYASTNKSVNILNENIRGIRKDLGRLGVEEATFRTKKRENEMETTVSTGDRIQFHATVKDREAGIELRNSEFGTVRAIDGNMMTVEIDGGRQVTFDAAKYNEWGLGYAGTIYKGQGKTNDKTFVLHDSNSLWKSNTSYVAMTRHKDDIQIYSSKDLAESTEQLGRLMERDGGQRAAIDFKEAPLSRDELKSLIQNEKEFEREEERRRGEEEEWRRSEERDQNDPTRIRDPNESEGAGAPSDIGGPGGIGADGSIEIETGAGVDIGAGLEIGGAGIEVGAGL
jgi:Ti-type conjugative transfer relaxase TraA